jgi:hypothetical protein
MNVKYAFPNGNLEGEVFIEQPEGFQLSENQDYAQTEEIPLWLEENT